MKFKKRVLIAAVLASITCVTQANMFTANKAIDEKDFKTALVELTKSAQVGNAQAQFKLGIMNFQGQAGKIDHAKAIAWFFLASEYEYPQALEFAEQLFQGLSQEEQDIAALQADELIKKYGKAAVNALYYPEVRNSPYKNQDINQAAKMLKRGRIHYSGAAAANARNQARIDSAIRNVRSNPSALTNLNKTLVNPDSGRVVVQYDVDIDGRTRQPEILFSWPTGQFDAVSLDSVLNSKLKPALRAKQKVEQFGLVAKSRFGIHGIATLREGYPHLYKQFKSHRNRAAESAHAKYIYACFLRAYKPILDDPELEAFEPVLLEAAESGHALAQYDYAQYQIYENDDIDNGIEWLIKAAKTGLLNAEYRLGRILFQSPSPYLKQDLIKADYWLNKAAQRGHTNAQQKLVELRLMQGPLAPEFAEQAIEWLEEIENDKAPQVFYWLAKLHDAINDKSSAEDYIEEAIEAGQRYKWNIADWQAYKKALES
ncbi:SEL1-like repeat protein [Algibacillus agarilyticus]|uniref:SEL1-like repeat protein n=1 Tax=Algibacillus agarilyticus TaxID=2234133 RepID=UPI000DD031F0|nr:SEL1-like repeat protein [Algibacillus agarilyticus]